MRILISIGLILASLALIAYSYLGAFAQIGVELEAAETPLSAFSMMLTVIERMASGDIPQLSGFLYAGLLLFVIAVVNLIGGRKRTDDDRHSL